MDTINSDFSRMIQADGFTRLQLKHMLMLATANMADDQVRVLLEHIGMTVDDLEL